MAEYLNATGLANFLRMRRGPDYKMAADWALDHPDEPAVRQAVDRLEKRLLALEVDVERALSQKRLYLPYPLPRATDALRRAILWHADEGLATDELRKCEAWLAASAEAATLIKSRVNAVTKTLYDILGRKEERPGA